MNIIEIFLFVIIVVIATFIILNLILKLFIPKKQINQEEEKIFLFSIFNEIFINFVEAIKMKNIKLISELADESFLKTINLNDFLQTNYFFILGRKIDWKDDNMINVEFNGTDEKGNHFITNVIFKKNNEKFIIYNII